MTTLGNAVEHHIWTKYFEKLLKIKKNWRKVIKNSVFYRFIYLTPSKEKSVGEFPQLNTRKTERSEEERLLLSLWEAEGWCLCFK